MGKKILAALMVLGILATVNAANYPNSGGVIQHRGVGGYTLWAQPDTTAAVACSCDADTCTDTLRAAGSKYSWYNLGRCASDPADSPFVCIVASGTGGGIAGSLFVTTKRGAGWSSGKHFLKHVAGSVTNNTGTIITDSMTSKSIGIYALPVNTNVGYEYWLKLFTYSGGSAIGIKRVFVYRKSE